MTLNFASSLDLATKDCFLLYYMIKFPPTNMQYCEVGLLCIPNPAQSDIPLLSNDHYFPPTKSRF